MVPEYLFLGPAPDFLDPKDYRLRRALEIIPGVLAWLTLCGFFLAAFFAPVVAGIFIIVFAFYWILNAIYFSIFLIRSWWRFRVHRRSDWGERLRALSGPFLKLPQVTRWEDIIHLVVFPVYKEGEDVVASSLEALAQSRFPSQNLWVVLATEARAGAHADLLAKVLTYRFSDRFGKWVVVKHPADLPNEIPGKGSNQTFAVEKVLRTTVDPAGIPYERIVLSSFDSDTHVYPDYFSCLTYHYLTAEEPLRSSFQPVPLFNNNIWDAPVFSRIAAIGSTAWQMFMQSQPDLQETFSSHSMSLKALVDVGFWNKRLVNEDSIIFWQCYVVFDGNYRVVPLHYPVSMDANVSRSTFRTGVSIYKQHRRWAYGVEKLVFAVFGFSKNPRIPLRKKIGWSVRLFVGFWMWACASPLLLTLGWLPVLVGGVEFRETVLAFNLPVWTRDLLLVASLGLLVNGALAFLLLPPRPKHVSRFSYITMFVQWPFMPFSMFLFGSIPALDAQTRMMLGKYLGFWVTEKIRKR